MNEFDRVFNFFFFLPFLIEKAAKFINFIWDRLWDLFFKVVFEIINHMLKWWCSAYLVQVSNLEGVDAGESEKDKSSLVHFCKLIILIRFCIYI